MIGRKVNGLFISEDGTGHYHIIHPSTTGVLCDNPDIAHQLAIDLSQASTTDGELDGSVMTYRFPDGKTQVFMGIRPDQLFKE